MKGKLYRHFKGGLYEVITEALSSVNEKRMIVYRSLDNGMVWVRDHDEFFETIEREGRRMLRFAPVGD